MLTLVVEVDVFSIFPCNGLANKYHHTLIVKFNDFCLMKCLHNSIAQIDTI